MKLSRSINIWGEYLNLPVEDGAPLVTVRLLSSNNRLLKESEVGIADERIDYRVFTYIEGFRGKELTIEMEGEGVNPQMLSSINQSNIILE